MSDNRRQRKSESKKKNNTRNNANHRKDQQSKKSSSRPVQRFEWPRWAIAILVGVIVGGGISWWMVSQRADTITPVPQPIAAIDAPDYHSLVFDAQDSERVFFGSHAGTQESHNGGRTWQEGGLRDADAMIMATSHNAPQTIYAAGHDVFQVSSDSGASWQPVDHNLPGTDIHGFAQNSDDPQRLYAFVVGYGGLTSDDGGSTWVQFGSQPLGGSYLLLASNGDILYAATDAGLSQSEDHGESWIHLANQPGKVTVISLAVSAADSQTIYVGAPIGLMRSTDGGTKWSMLGPDVPTLAIAVAPTDPDRILTLSNTGAIYRSDDRGATWDSGQ